MANDNDSVKKLPELLGAVFETQEARDLDDISLQCLFLIAFHCLGETHLKSASTVPEISILGDVFREHEFSRPDLWDEVYWPLDLPDPSQDPELSFSNLTTSDLLPILSPNRTDFPFIRLEESEMDEEEDLYYFRVYMPMGREDEVLVEMIRSSERLKEALIQSASRRANHWAGERAAACLRAL